MSYQFPPDLEERVKARMMGGAYRSEDELLREALDALDERERAVLERWQQANQAAMEQSRLGLSKPLDLEGLLSRVERRIATHQQAE
jgi:Arc/MetJ-type ribon-helix-helix transcriptional regulator